ncbi:MAG: hypothetical protein JW839_02350 [Candidatus Lokiarchaeota archaeon]|nr:hypothetical protein [Candidatus Lokiarchaeota archaeon]
MNKHAILAKLAEIESSIKEIRDILHEEASDEQELQAESADDGGEDKGDSTRIACPKCGSLKIIKHVDKAKVLYYHQGAPIYAKKGVCSQCGTEMPL